MYNHSDWVSETDPRELLKKYEVALLRSGFKIEGRVEKHFEPQGYTLLILLAESHFAVHTFPEQGRTYIELSSCVKEPFLRFIEHNT